MKKLLIIVILFLFTSCGIIIPAVKVTDFADFREFKDFYFTESNSVSFQFTPLGIVSAVRVSGDEEITTQNKNSEPKYGYIRATSQDALRLIYDKAKIIGANGIINIKLEYLKANDSYGSNNGYFVTGMAIKKD